MINIALTAGSLATGATPGRGLNKQGSQAIDLSSTLPRRNSEDEASWAEHLSPDPSSARSDESAGGINSPSVAMAQNDALAHASGGGSRKKGVLGSMPSGGAGGEGAAHVALNLAPGAAVKKLTKTAGVGGAGDVKPIELAWDFSLSVTATKREQKLTGKDKKPILTNVAGSVRSGQMMAVMGSSGAFWGSLVCGAWGWG